MLSHLYPWAYVENVFVIDYKELYRRGFRGILFDLDNTLVHHGEDSNDKVDRLFRYLKKIGFQTMILSDNDEERIRRFLKNIDLPYISDANKPAPESYEKAVRMLGLSKEQVIMVGDQIFTDIYGANRCGIANILVRFMRKPEEKHYGKRRFAEQIILRSFEKDRGKEQRLGEICRQGYENIHPRRRLFCEIHPVCYAISEKKEILKRHLKDYRNDDVFAREIKQELLPNVIWEQECPLIKYGQGIDPELQFNKADNIAIAAKTMNRLIIHPGETFSFWKRVGRLTRRKGYKKGRIIMGNKLIPGIGGGLCNLANIIHILVLHSPLTVTEFHSHSDALAPDHGKRIPFSAGTSVSYNQIDYRFRNDTDQKIQLRVWCKGNLLCAQLRSEKEFPWTYEISEEDHHFRKEGKKYYRVSKIYKDTYQKEEQVQISHELVLDNHSEVMFDPSLLPAELIRGRKATSTIY